MSLMAPQYASRTELRTLCLCCYQGMPECTGRKKRLYIKPPHPFRRVEARPNVQRLTNVRVHPLRVHGPADSDCSTGVTITNYRIW